MDSMTTAFHAWVHFTWKEKEKIHTAVTKYGIFKFKIVYVCLNVSKRTSIRYNQDHKWYNQYHNMEL
jgi:hypothetical protein